MLLKIEHYHHHNLDKSALTGILQQLERIERKVDKIMAISAETQAVVDRLNTASNKIAEKLRELATKIEEGGMSKTDEAEVVNQLGVIASGLEAMGTDPANPVP